MCWVGAECVKVLPYFQLSAKISDELSVSVGDE